ncbi:MAG: hypothetical protein WCO96_05830 [Actinomycetes bacterium]
MTGGDQEREGLLDDVGELVEDVLGENLPEPEPEDPWERRLRLVDAITAVLLSVAAVATAWATFQASQWADAQSDSVAAASIARSDSLRYSNDAGQIEQIDTAVWLEWLTAYSQGDKARARFLSERFRPTLAAAQREWAGKAVIGSDGKVSQVPPGTPFDGPAYRIPKAERAEQLANQAESEMVKAQEASNTSTEFVTAALILALVLFFSGIATKFRNPRLQVLLVLLALVFLVGGLARTFTLPQLL